MTHKELMLQVKAGVVKASETPVIQLTWNEESCDLSPAEARHLAFGILTATESAQMACAIVGLLKNIPGISEDMAATVAEDIINYRHFLEVDAHKT